MTKPILKWAGGKTKLLTELRSRAPRSFGRYFEPFLGGGAMYFALDDGPPAALGDMNPHLIATYQALADLPEDVIGHLSGHELRHRSAVRLGRPYYYKIRDWWNQTGVRFENRAESAATLLYLNKACFNGLWRVNKDGAFNVPEGDRLVSHDLVNLRAASCALRMATLHHGPYIETTAGAKRGDFVYIDPPYDAIVRTESFTGYTRGAFGRDEQATLADYARTLWARGAFVMISNRDTAFVRSLYRGFCFSRVACGRSIGASAASRGSVGEVIITTERIAASKSLAQWGYTPLDRSIKRSAA